ncbi:MAG: hypothetical protein VX341_10930 [Bdellovibrionota bacterium]|nr:hypothetical protein [Bdellovibrionota bacterium]
MKSLIKIISFLIISYSASAFNWFPVQSYCQLNQGQGASCQVCNWQGYRPIFCRMNVVGRSSYGAFFNGFQQGWVYPGQCISGFVRANNPYYDPLVFANANAQCRF